MAFNPERIIPKHGTAARWAAINHVLGIGEVGFETDTRKEKRGDGVTAWNDLPYVSDSYASAAAIASGDAATLVSARAYADGKAIAAGGAINQMLVKKSATSYDTQWIDPPPPTDAGALHDRGVWAYGPYALNDVVTYQNKYYKCTTPVTGVGASIVGSSSAMSTTAGAITVPLPAGTQAGDLFFLAHSSSGTGITSRPAPAGFTQIGNSAGNATVLYTYYKTVTAADVTAGSISTGAIVGSGVYGQSAALFVLRSWAGTPTIGPNGIGLAAATLATPTSYPSWLIQIAGSMVKNTGQVVPSTNYTAGRVNSTNSSGGNSSAVGMGAVVMTSGSFNSGGFTSTQDTGNGDANWHTVYIPQMTTAFPAASFTEIAAIHDANGRLQSADPAAPGDVSTKSYTDASLVLAKLYADGKFKGNYASATNYALGDIVIYQNRTYACSAAVSASPIKGTSSIATTATTAIPIPAGAAVGDIFIMMFNGSQPGATPSGVTLLGVAGANGVGGQANQVFTKTLTSTDVANGVITWTGASGVGVWVNMLLSNTVTVNSANYNKTTGLNTPVISALNPGYLIVGYAAASSTIPSLAGSSNLVAASGGANNVAALATEPMVAGNTPTYTWSGSATSAGTVAIPVYVTPGFPAASFTEIGSQGSLRDAGAYAVATNYSVGDVITYQNRSYVCRTAVSASPIKGTSKATTTNVVPIPAGAVVGDILLMAAEGASLPGTPTGVTSVCAVGASGLNGSNGGVYQKTLTSADVLAGTITFTAASTWVTILLSSAATIDVAHSSGVQNTLTTPAVTSTGAGYLVVGFSTAGWSTAPSLASASNVISSWSGGSTGVALGTEPLVAGTTPTYAWTATGSFFGTFAVPVYVAGGFPTANFVEIGAIHDANGRLQASDPAAPGDLSTKAYVDGKYKGDWNGSNYDNSDIVRYSGKLYICKTAFAVTTASFVGTTTASGNGQYINLPAGAQAGDLAIISCADGSYDNAPPTGWTKRAEALKATLGSTYAGVYSKVLAAADITAGRINYNGGSHQLCYGIMHVFRNCTYGTDANVVETNATATAGYPEQTALTPANVPSYAFHMAFAGYLDTSVSLPNTITTYNNGMGAGYEPLAAQTGPYPLRTWASKTGTTPGLVYSAVILGPPTTFPFANFDEVAIDPQPQVLATGAGKTVDDVIAYLQTLGLAKQS